ncbi:Ldh family oxidoreductase [Mycolicibacterium sp. S2-37]|uniref:Ldh family oxidoreductase n=1 Tax=Mycolicibacterium sp. S2-37 TaxID=2810297 RepID=UPI001A94BC3C|nr:Ldh family oxidoreductase [Mycolicibacterium sp. S2-37]MBO0678652.1 Ldh family oxidoreductase [Mycolicibacterium sp. S2-37]
MTRYRAPVLASFAADVLRACEVAADHARVTADRLVEADVRGRTGHGLIRLPSYVERITAGGVNVRAEVAIRHETPVSALVDGDNGLGQVVMTRATELAIGKARDAGVAWVGTVHSNHAGAAGIYAQMAADAGYVGIYLAVANANAMPPWGGTNPLLGTNPLAIAVPAQPHPFVLDIATTAASHGTIKVAAQSGRQMPAGWVADAAGNPITDPTRAHEGFLLPMGGYKGAGLAIAIGLLAGVLNGAAFGSEVVDHRRDAVTPTNTGQSILVLRPDLFRPRDEVLADLSGHLEALRDSGTVDGGPVRLPGDASARTRRDNDRFGVELPPVLVDDLGRIGRELGVGPLSAEEDV